MWSAPHSETVFRVLREVLHSLGPGQRCTDSSPGSTALAGESDCLTSGQRLAPSLRTSGRLRVRSIELRPESLPTCVRIGRELPISFLRACTVLGLRLIQLLAAL